MSRLIECVPNFSEGRNKEIIEAIANAIGSTSGCNLLDVDPGVSTNRTVYTFVGTPDAVVEGALNAARIAAHLIDMTLHSGEHPRIGTLDVCPFVPIKNTTMEDCIECAKEFGERLAAEFGFPVYLYGNAASEAHRTDVPQIRAGEYEGLKLKLSSPEWKPDYGPAEFVPRWGATMVGARKFLIAYNVNLLSTKEQAHRIALNIRENGRSKEEPGRLKSVQAIGWYLEEANMAQVSANITDIDVTPIHKVYEECVKDAKDLDLAVVGSQIVGLVPLSALLQAAEFYIEKDGLFLLEEDQKLRLVVDRLGLHTLGPFNPKERIIEYMISEPTDGPLQSMEIREFIGAVAARSPSPGGGSVSALVASLGAALGTMSGFLTFGNKKFSHLDSKIRKILPKLNKGTKDLLPFVDADAAAFNEYMAALKLPKDDPELQKAREELMQSCLADAISIPMSIAISVNQLWPSLKDLAEICNLSCKSDLQVGVKCLETGVWGAYQNVQINLADIKDAEFKSKVDQDSKNELKTAQSECKAILEIIGKRTD